MADVSSRGLALAWITAVTLGSMASACERTSAAADTARKVEAPTAMAAAQRAPAPTAPTSPSHAAPMDAKATLGANASASSIKVPAGSVTLAGKRVSVAAFLMDRTEVTVRDYLACANTGACSATPKESGCNAARAKQRAEHPINCVTLEQAKRFCAARGARLPSVAEWSLAAGGPEGRIYPWGGAAPSNFSLTEEPPNGAFAPGPARHNLCWVGDGTAAHEKYPTGTCAVGSYAAGNTPLNLADLAGNVWEWTSDAITIPRGEPNYVLKGGSFEFNPMGGPPLVKVSDEISREQDYYAPDVGFRCVG
ncbi:MAG: hypothetical protein RL701_5471 [Pseudomonadota bacterium]